MKKEFTNLGKDKTNEFKSQLQKHDVWHLKDVANSYIGAINGKTLKVYPSIDSFDEFISNNDYSFIKTNTENEKFITLEHETLFLWSNDVKNTKTRKNPFSIEDIKKEGTLSLIIKGMKEREEQAQKSPVNYDKAMQELSSVFGIANWTLPYKKDLVKFAKNANNPHLAKNGLLLSSDNKPCKKWCTLNGEIDFENLTAPLSTSASAAIFAVNKQWEDSSSWIIFSEIIRKIGK